MDKVFDFNQFKINLEIATRNCFLRNVEIFGNQICAFSLISDDGAMTVVPFTNTSNYLKKLQIEDPENKGYYEFSPWEWKKDDGSITAFSALSEALYDSVSSDGVDFANFKSNLFESCVQVLEKLRKESFFRNHLDQDLLILFSIPDTFTSNEKLISWAKRLNKDEASQRYAEWLLVNN